MTSYLVVAAGGALGAAARYGFGNLSLRILGTALPWGTLGVNVIGSFVIGVLGTMAVEFGVFSAAQRQFLIVGILGGFTTVSSFSFELNLFAREDDYLRAGLYMALTFGACVVAVLSGAALTRALR